MFNPDFFPTQPDVAALMLDPLDLRGKTVLEPSAGKGDLVRECLTRGAAVNARYARIKGQVLPETHRRPKARRQGVAA